jgi:hypothetical protein
MAMDTDSDFSLNPSETIYGGRAIKLDTVTQDNCYLGSRNSPCIGISVTGTEFAPGMIGSTTGPLPAAQVGDNSKVAVYGLGRRCLWEVDPNYGGQVKPGDLCVSYDSGYLRPATPSGPWNQWVLAISTSFASGGYCANVKIMIFPWAPTGS